MDKEKIGSRIRQARKAQGLTQESLARRANISLNGVAQLEQGERNDPHYSTLKKLASALGLTVAQLLEGPVVLGKDKAPTESQSGRREVTGAGGIASAEDFGTPEVIDIRLEKADLERYLCAIERGELSVSEVLTLLTGREA